MSLLSGTVDPSMDVSTAQFAPQITGLVAGEDLNLGAPCYLKTTDGAIYMSNGTSANEAAEVLGFCPRAVKSGEPVTLFGNGTRFRYKYPTDLTPGNILYVGATKGLLDTAATTGDAVGVAQVLTAQDIVVIHTPKVG
jgi:hypothetical protein